MRRVLLAAAVLVVSAGDCAAQAMVWKAEKGGEVVYLGGTIHLLRESDLPIPAQYETAYDSADLILLETDIGAVNTPEFQQKLMLRAALPEGRRLDSLLSKEAYDALSSHCAEAGLPIEVLGGYRPSVIVLMLLGVEILKMGADPEYGVDLFFFRRARGEGKETAYFEDVDEQLEYLVTMGEGYESEFVLQSLGELDTTAETIDEMIGYWKTGDAGKMHQIMTKEMKEKHPRLYQTLLLDRNAKWLEAIEDLFETEEDEFVLVGAAHLIGDDGILAVLEDRGYSVEQLR